MKIICPHCGSPATMRIVYGYPSPQTFKEARMGRVMLGGSVRSDSDPDWHCKHCGKEWSESRRPA